MIVLDGHSILHAIPELMTILKRDPITAMQRLLGRAMRESKITVVFDGKQPAPFPTSHVKVIFADSMDHKYERADMVIRELVINKKASLVVTRDEALRSTITQLGGKVVDPEVWYSGKSQENFPKLTKHNNSNLQNKRGPGGTHTEWIDLFRNRPRDDTDDS